MADKNEVADQVEPETNGSSVGDNEALKRTIESILGGSKSGEEELTFDQFATRMLSPTMSPVLNELVEALVESRIRIRTCLQRLRKAEEK